MAERLSLDALDGDRRLDDRWTESKLVAAGYRYHGDGACRDCGDPVSFYKREPVDATKPVRWQVVDEGSLATHRCKG